MSLLNGKHTIKEIDGVRCTVVEQGASAVGRRKEDSRRGGGQVGGVGVGAERNRKFESGHRAGCQQGNVCLKSERSRWEGNARQ